jgi:exonuclease I
MTRRNTTVVAVDPAIDIAAGLLAGQAELAALMGMGAFSDPLPLKVRAARKALFAPNAVVTDIVPNPKRAGSKEYVKFAQIEIGMNEKQLRKLGYNTWDLTHLVSHDHVTITTNSLDRAREWGGVTDVN